MASLVPPHSRLKTRCCVHCRYDSVAFATDPGYRAANFEACAADRPLIVQVRKTPSWPRRWANSSLLQLHPTGMHGPTTIVWSNLIPFSLQFAGDDGPTLLQAARHAQAHCDAVDLNLGCPQARRAQQSPHRVTSSHPTPPHPTPPHHHLITSPHPIITSSPHHLTSPHPIITSSPHPSNHPHNSSQTSNSAGRRTSRARAITGPTCCRRCASRRGSSRDPFLFYI
jgi:hypothetical protein